MRFLSCLLVSVLTLCACSMPAEAGLFGRPSKREMMQKMIAQQEQSHGTLMRIEANQRESHQLQILMYGEMKTQVELTRHLLGHAAHAAEASEKAAETSAKVWEGVKLNTSGPFTRLPPGTFQTPESTPTMPRGTFQTPATTPTFPQGTFQTAPSEPTMPPGSFQMPELPQIQGSRRPDPSFAAKRQAIPIKTVSWTNPQVTSRR